MTETRKPPAPGAAEPGTRHGQDLKRVSESLKELVASLRSDRDRIAGDPKHAQDLRHAAEARPAAPPPAAPAAAPAPDAIDLEKKRLAAELALAREALTHANEERERLRSRLAEIEAENQRMCDDYVAVQEKTTDLAQLYVALERIHGGVSRGETLAAVQEIVINVVGSEELAIFELRGDRLVLVQSFGIDPEPWREIPAGRGAIGRAAAGEVFVAGRSAPAGPGEEDLTACIPLRVADRVAGALAIFRLLGHKPVLGEADQAVFDLLSTHAGVALHLRPAREARV